MDERVKKLSDLLVNYSTSIQPGEKCLIDYEGEATKPLICQLIKDIYKAGGLPYVRHRDSRVNRELLMNCTKKQIKTMAKIQMEEMKEMFFEDDEECFQFHPKMDNYINNNEYTLHIWRRKDGKMEPPPHILVGIRRNHEQEDLEAAKTLHENIGCPLSDEELRMIYLSSTPEGMKQLEKEIQNMNPGELALLCAKMGII